MLHDLGGNIARPSSNSLTDAMNEQVLWHSIYSVPLNVVAILILNAVWTNETRPPITSLNTHFFVMHWVSRTANSTAVFIGKTSDIKKVTYSLSK